MPVTVARQEALGHGGTSESLRPHRHAHPNADALQGPVAPRHDTDEDPHKLLVEPPAYLWDVSDLDSPTLTGTHVSTTTRAIDHDQYINGKCTYQSNYQAGLRILDVTDIANGNLTEVAFFDMLPDSDSPLLYKGAWGNYPFFGSGIVIVSVRTQGLYAGARWRAR